MNQSYYIVDPVDLFKLRKIGLNKKPYNHKTNNNIMYY